MTLTRMDSANAKYHEVKCQCPDCNGTGLYVGFAEPKGTAVVCLRCNGKGWIYLSYAEFTGRKRKSGVKKVCISSGNFLATGVGPKQGTEMSYDEFEKAFPS